MCRKWYPLETKDVNKEFLDDIESDREASNGHSTDDDSEDENVAEMDDEALYIVVAPEDFFIWKESILNKPNYYCTYIFKIWMEIC